MPLSAAAMPPIGETISVAWACTLVYWDWRYRRLPNVLTLGAGLVGVAFLAITGASPLGAGGTSMLAGSGLALLLTLPGYFLRQLGAGDVKLLVAVALLGGSAAALVAFVIGSLATITAAGAWVFLGARFGLLPGSGKWLPFGASLAVGFVVAVVFGQVGEVPWPR